MPKSMINLDWLNYLKSHDQNRAAKIIAGEMRDALGITQANYFASLIRSGNGDGIAQLLTGEKQIQFFNVTLNYVVILLDICSSGTWTSFSRGEVKNVKQLEEYSCKLAYNNQQENTRGRFDSADYYEYKTLYETLRKEVMAYEDIRNNS